MRRTATLAREAAPVAVMNAAAGYDLAASSYDSWRWSLYWDEVEAPLFREWLSSRPAGNVVDLGCGTGRYRAVIQGLGNSYVGVDVSAKMLAENRKKHSAIAGSRGATLIRADIRRTELPSASADSIVCARVLSHVESPDEALAEICRILKPGGECFLSDIDPSHAYECTHMPTPHGDVAIETYKHSWKAVWQAIREIDGLTLLRRDVYSQQSFRAVKTPTTMPSNGAAARRALLDVSILGKVVSVSRASVVGAGVRRMRRASLGVLH